jgi:hypothetical protein
MDPLINDRLHEFLENHGLKKIKKKDVMLPISLADGIVGMYFFFKKKNLKILYV